MNRRRRTEILIKGRKEVAKNLANEVEEKYDVNIVEEPNNGLTMIKIRESVKKSLFYIGEILVAEAKVSINGNLGIGIVSGDNHELAYSLAVIDAAYNANLCEIEGWEVVLLEEEKLIKEDEEKLKSRILMTRVNFETMDV